MLYHLLFAIDQNLSQAELMLKTISEIINQLVDAHEKKKRRQFEQVLFFNFLMPCRLKLCFLCS